MSFNLLGKIASEHVRTLVAPAEKSAADGRGGWVAYSNRPVPKSDPGTDLMEWSNRRRALRGSEPRYSPEVMQTYRDVYSPMTSQFMGAKRKANMPSLGAYMRGVRASQDAAGTPVQTPGYEDPVTVWNGQKRHR